MLIMIRTLGEDAPCSGGPAEQTYSISGLPFAVIAMSAQKSVHGSELAEARKDRASIVAFLTAEAVRFDAAQPMAPSTVARDRLQAQASLLRTLAAQIARGDDRLGGDQ